MTTNRRFTCRPNQSDTQIISISNSTQCDRSRIVNRAHATLWGYKGSWGIYITSSNISGAGFTVSGISPGESLSPNQSLPVTVQFAPTVAGAVSGNLSLVSNATNSPTVSLSGTGAQQVSHTVGVAWTASTSSVVGYNVYRGTVSGGPYATVTSSPVASTQFTDPGVQSGQTYYYVVTAVDSSNVESAFSGQATATIP